MSYRDKEKEKGYRLKYNLAHKVEIAEKRREYLESHRLQAKERSSRYYQAHKVEIAKHNKIYNQTHKLEIARWSKEYYQTHKVQIGQYRQDHREKNVGYARQYHRDHKDKVAGYFLKLRMDVLTYYGNGKLSCVRCGFSDIRALSIDHINGGGRQHKLLIGFGNFYSWLRKSNYPQGYQTLCHNCQWVKKDENREVARGGKYK